jgi:hypothetical protein
MEKIYSKIDKSKLLHVVVRKKNFISERTDLIPENQFIQCSILKMNEGKTFKPHKHIWKERSFKCIAQESWVVIDGSVKCMFYDINDTLLEEVILYPGDASFTLEGGHNYLILEENTLVYEYKTGPYEGQKFDKKFIE